MQQNFENIIFLTGTEEILRNMPFTPVQPLFSEKVQAFLSALSKMLLEYPQIREYPDLLDYAFWIRPASLYKMSQQYPNRNHKIGRGVTFHIAPSNVPMAFALSFTAGLLAGNGCIVRLSKKEFPQSLYLIKMINQLLESEYSYLKPYLCFIQYSYDEKITAELSAICDVRVIWGGNQTIQSIRRAPLQPRAIELTFADRYSIAVINADAYMDMDCQEIAKRFYLDTYYSDQNACSSPRLIYWIGKQIIEARQRFWNVIKDQVQQNYKMPPIQSVNKLQALCRLAADHPNIKKESRENQIVRVYLPKLFENVMDYKESGGYFLEYQAENLEDLILLLGKPCQTIACLGISPEIIWKLILENGVRGVDRIVPLGKTMELSLIWDGFDLVESMSRQIDWKR